VIGKSESESVEWRGKSGKRNLKSETGNLN